MRTHYCGNVDEKLTSQEVTVAGWVHRRRDHGGVIFVDLRDREGLLQVVFDPDSKDVFSEAERLRGEFVIQVKGTVRARPAGTVNANLKSGQVELLARELVVLNRSEPLPFQLDEHVSEEVRLKYRYLDLRREVMLKRLRQRHHITRAMRSYLDGSGYIDLETPVLGKSTPEGARDYLVPSRTHAGKFFALPQSPQIFKQLLMVAGFDRYYQIVRCFRDEDLRLDRQPEFTQIDIEMSFVTEPILQSMMEGLMKRLWKDVLGVEIQTPLRRMTYAEAMEKYGVDKPDLRLDLVLCDVSEAARESGISFFTGLVKCLRVPANEKLTRKILDELSAVAKQHGSTGVAYAKVGDGGAWTGSLAKTVTDAARAEFNRVAGAQPGDTLIFAAGKAKVVNSTLGAIRLFIGDKLGLTRKGEYQFMWLTDPPLFEVDEETGEVAAAHHPFTSPRALDEGLLESAPGKVLARAYDLVLNGVEVGGGSIRIHRSDLQARVFKALGISDEDARAKFGFLLDAFKFGPPPHGGVAFGLDRLSMLMTGAESLRDVIAFPKTQKGSDLMTDCPTPVAQKQLDELFVKVAAELLPKS
ncbi:MAG TPA: aspartate--tRNA ligase [Kofleriaceae bacterium]